MSIQQIVGSDRYEKMRGALRELFPDEKMVIADAQVDAAFQIAKHEWRSPELEPLPIPAPTAPAAQASGQFQYYEALATHARKLAPGSVFTGHLPMVRIRLPDHGTTQTLPELSTPAGRVLPVDRLNPSIDVLWATYGKDPLLPHGRPERVDFITPPRLEGARFAAISTYLCYAKASDPAPCFYVLEAGLASGYPRMSYLARSMDETVLYQTLYEPTFFAKKWHWYVGHLEMCPGAPGEPKTLTVKVFEEKPPSAHYLEVTVDYVARSQPLMTNPFHITIAAGARMQAIADALGMPSGLTNREWFLRLVGKLAADSLFSTPPTPKE